MKKILLIYILYIIGTCASGASVYQVLSDGIELSSASGKVRLQVYSDKIIRVSSIPQGDFVKDSSLVVVPGERQHRFNVKEFGDTVCLLTNNIKACISKTSGIVVFYDKNGCKILAEKNGGRKFTPICVEGKNAYTVRQVFESLDDSEGIYGLGQHQSDEFNYKGKNEQLFQYNTKVSVPFVISTNNYGLLWDSYSLCRWGNPDDYRQLGEIFNLYDRSGKKGCLTGIYTDRHGNVMEREEPQIYFEHLIRGDLSHVVNAPRDFDMAGSKIVFEGEIEPKEEGEHEFILYYSGYQSIDIEGKKIVDTRWRTAWNPNSYKFSVPLKKGKRVPIRIEWQPDGSVAYCGLRAYAPRSQHEKSEMSWWGEMQDMIDYYFIYGDNMDDIISGYRSLTGKAPIMPKWAMGFWQSREKYNTQDEVLTTFKEFRHRHIPIDNIVIDWLHWPQSQWGCHEFDKERFPDPKGMVDSIHAMNGRVMVSVWPKFYADTEHFKEFDSRGWMYRGAIRDSIRDWVGPGYLGSFYDAYDMDARKLFWSQINDHYMPLGIDAWWMDASEPNIRDCIDIEYRKALMTPTALGPSTQYFNAYALVNADAIYSGQRGVVPDKRVFLLTRSGFAGQQRYSTATWSGDIATRWEDMKAQISAGLNFSASGIPYWTMDIGGFCVEARYVKAQKLYDSTGEENDDLREWRELNTRWYQFGTFVPLFRSHGQWPFREVFNIAPENHPAYKSIVEYINLRYRLMPYIYSLAAKTYFDDYTIMRPMVMDFSKDHNTRNIKDQYMFGSSILVAPVCEYGLRQREVYLPEGEKWYDFHTGHLYEGGQTIIADAPYNKLPLFIKGGSIMPIGQAVQYSMEKTDVPLTIVIYGGKDAEFTLYEDDGLSFNYENGEYCKIKFSYSEKNKSLKIAKYEGLSKKFNSRAFRIVKAEDGEGLSNLFRNNGQIITYTGKDAIVKL